MDGDQWDVIEYEWNMARNLIHYLPDEKFDDLEPTIGNAVVESLVLHLRVLVEFAISKGKGPDDIRLEDLLPELGDSTITRELKSLYGSRDDTDSPCWQFNKMLAHATKHRSKSHDYVGPIKSIWPVLEALMNTVMSQRPKEWESP